MNSEKAAFHILRRIYNQYRWSDSAPGWFQSMVRKLSCLIFLLCMSSLIAQPSRAADVSRIFGQTMGTTYSIKWHGGSLTAEQLQELVGERLVEINSLMSTYDPDSELSKFNSSSSTEWFAVSEETALVVSKALEIYQLTGGAFDPTVGRLVSLWSFGADNRTYEPPASEAIEEALAHVGADRLEVRHEPPALRKADPGIELDLSAIAKGYGVDAVTTVLQGQGIEHCLVEIGGETRAVGTNRGKPWLLGIEVPSAIPGEIDATVPLHDRSLATSGDYRNYFEKDGVTYSHTINPTTGYPVTHRLASASVVSHECMDADAWATAMMVLGTERGLQRANELGLSVYLLTRTESGGYEHAASTEGVTVFQPLVAGADVAAVPEGNPWLTMLLAVGVFVIALIGLAVGVIFSNRELKGSCGGINGLKDDEGRSICEMCTVPPEECDQVREQAASSASTRTN